MEIKSLVNTSDEIIYSGWADAFKDYARSWTSDEYKKLLVRRGYDSSLSFGAFDGDRLVSFVLNGIGDWNGQKTAYDTGTGTIPEYRGRRLIKHIFSHSIPFLENAGIKQCLLEVLDNNDKAINVYRNLGFKVVREFNYFIQYIRSIVLSVNNIDHKYSVKPHLAGFENNVIDFWDFNPSWQNSFECINRNPGDFIAYGSYYEDKLMGYGIIEPTSGDISQLAIHPDFRRQGFATVLFAELLKQNKHSAIKIINTDRSCTGITDFLKSCNIPVSGGQYEMVLEL